MPSFRWAVAFALTGVLLGAYEATVALYAAHSAPSVQLGGVGNCTLVVAHPDDEAMFFAPSVVALRSACTLHVFFMTTGALPSRCAPPPPLLHCASLRPVLTPHSARCR